MFETSRRPVAPGSLAQEDPDGAPDTIASRLDRLPITPLHLTILAICTLGLFTDVAEVALSNALGAIFLAPPHSMPRGSLSLLLASVFAGGAVGAPIFGLIGDRFGRRTALQATLVLMAVGSAAAAMSSGLTELTVARAVSGFAIGGFPPLAATYLADVMPPRRRGAMLMVCTGIGFLGGTAVILVVQALTPAPPLGIEAWRWALVLGAVLAVLGAALFAVLPDSPRWLAAVGRDVEAERACRRFEAAGGIVPLGAGAEATRHPQLPMDASFWWLLAEPRQRRRTALFVALYALSPWATVGLAFNTAAAIYGGLLAVYATELLSTASRASALTCAWAGGRVAAALTPIVLLPVLDGYGIHAMFAVLTATLIASGALVLSGPRGRSGRPVTR